MVIPLPYCVVTWLVVWLRLDQHGSMQHSLSMDFADHQCSVGNQLFNMDCNNVRHTVAASNVSGVYYAMQNTNLVLHERFSGDFLSEMLSAICNHSYGPAMTTIT